ncbi:thiamine-phosphate diphosphorylase [Fictibacillus enclensis]|uniref:Thiamine-phosphate synthase n=1 Tax=Fictibacillus enclensis TaxID=1017270 RepID=A0A0V8JC32_9BACL|nr:thiamine phosphate synthase [Fictibacillus enclensis]KSU84722.1 thiamine-phosphate pyrophosphorylase [Fictibacillus enclensis]SCB84440.1 thiamine-phosphate diphosphorylase [Fictibacillus enclensis]
MNKAELQDRMKVYFIMGSTNCSADAEEVLEKALIGGATIFQFREKGEGCLEGNDRIELAMALQQICGRFNVPFIINDDIHLMKKLNADGLHVGQEDGDLKEIRNAVPGKLLGVSVHNLNEAWLALEIGADYLGVGPVYPTGTKTDTRPVMGYSVIRELRDNGIDAPIVGIGGINKDNASGVVQAGADGVAVITAISNHLKPAEAAGELLKAVENAKQNNSLNKIIK